MIPIRALALAGAAAFGCDLALAADPPPTTQTDQVVVPQVDRRGIRLPKFPSNDFEVGLFGGSYATQNFGTSFVGGLRLGYHITEDFFVEGVYAHTNVSDKEFRRILPDGCLVLNIHRNLDRRQRDAPPLMSQATLKS